VGPGQKKKRKRIQFKFEIDISNLFKLDSIHIGPFELGKFEIKYGWKVFQIRNNFPYTNFLRFEMDLELKFRESSMSWQQGKIDCNFVGTRILMKLGQQIPFYTLLEEKINSQQKRIRILNSF
jgi:hypothetical protein